MLKILGSVIVFAVLSFFLICSCNSSSNSGEGKLKQKIIKVSYDDPVDFASEIHLTAWIFQFPLQVALERGRRAVFTEKRRCPCRGLKRVDIL